MADDMALFLARVGGGRIITPDGRRCWWPEQDAEPIDHEPLGEEWVDVGYTSEEDDNG